jgi:hypothetical protein
MSLVIQGTVRAAQFHNFIQGLMHFDILGPYYLGNER